MNQPITLWDVFGAVSALTVAVVFALMSMTLPLFTKCPRWLVLTVRVTAASYGATAVLRIIPAIHANRTALGVVLVVGLISICVLTVSWVYAMILGRSGREKA
jgi:hypothetical protein